MGATFTTGAALELGGLTGLIQAKLQAAKVGRRIVDQLRGGLNRSLINRWVVTNNEFTPFAKKSAENDYLPVAD